MGTHWVRGGGRVVVLALRVGLFASIASCSDGGDTVAQQGSASYCDVYVGRLRECGLIDQGRFEGCVNYLDQAEVCETQCARDASCNALALGYCASEENGFFACLRGCIGLSDVTCSDGTTAGPWGRCDGILACNDGADEADCPVVGGYKCRHVDQFVPYAMHCDGTTDCSDGSDELPDCAPALTCDGVELPTWLYCNGIIDCSDAADEPAGCAVNMCMQ